MNVSVYMKGVYEEFRTLKSAENKANSKPIPDKMTVLGAEELRLPQSLRSFAMTLVDYLKKQSQFAKV